MEASLPSALSLCGRCQLLCCTQQAGNRPEKGKPNKASPGGERTQKGSPAGSFLDRTGGGLAGLQEARARVLLNHVALDLVQCYMLKEIQGRLPTTGKPAKTLLTVEGHGTDPRKTQPGKLPAGRARLELERGVGCVREHAVVYVVSIPRTTHPPRTLRLPERTNQATKLQASVARRARGEAKQA